MKTHTMLALASVASATLISIGPTLASADPVGEWRTSDGSTTVAIRPCGDNLCGFVASTTSPQDPTIGREIFYDMKPHGNEWSGIIVDIVAGQRYSGNISLIGDGKLRVEGCALGGLFCGDQQWARVR
ncbi:DUF2147 domain-containing protein [Methylovirgula sp. HY1]|uniref:DUF2147 domain-containing protein n=1 Tax=Methylovirgula sp. HY1 TaxID=2822761 RepID=UPI001C5AF651|nr:DUF2147 domain-containing protein [Methylovirgula sp. HY1]QXX73877.1 hypothetical protein MHY1_00678 [Methylovirgula sp. HY1]